MLRIFVVCLAAFILCLQTSCSDWSERKVAESKLRGGKIILALERYYQKNFRYPDKLDELIPEYMDVILTPLAGGSEVEVQNFCQ